MNSSEIFSTGMFAFIIMMPPTSTPITHTHTLCRYQTRRMTTNKTHHHHHLHQQQQQQQQHRILVIYICVFSIYNPRVYRIGKLLRYVNEWATFFSVVHAFVSSDYFDTYTHFTHKRTYIKPLADLKERTRDIEREKSPRCLYI